MIADSHMGFFEQLLNDNSVRSYSNNLDHAKTCANNMKASSLV
jgi:hypothetical protein